MTGNGRGDHEDHHHNGENGHDDVPLPLGVGLYPPEHSPLHARTAILYRKGLLAVAEQDLPRVKDELRQRKLHFDEGITNKDLRIAVLTIGDRPPTATSRLLERLRGEAYDGRPARDGIRAGLGRRLHHLRKRIPPPPHEIPVLVKKLRQLPDAPRVSPVHVLALGSHILWSPAVPPRPPALGYPEGRLPDDSENPHPVIVGVIDSGAVRHPWFGGHLDARSDPDPTDVAPPDGCLDLNAGHGTFIAGVILDRVYGQGGQPPTRPVHVLVQRVVGDDGIVDDVQLAERIVSIAGEVDVLSLSLGGYALDDSPPVQLENAFNAARERNPDLIVVAAAGNQASDRPFWPAAFKSVIAVGALDGNLPACFSDYGWWVSMWAPGVDVVSTFLQWQGPLDPRWSQVPLTPKCQQRSQVVDPAAQLQFPGWAIWSGTSFAAPRVAADLASAIAGGATPGHAVADLLSLVVPQPPAVPAAG
jgi:hypothetical protein